MVKEHSNIRTAINTQARLRMDIFIKAHSKKSAESNTPVLFRIIVFMDKAQKNLRTAMNILVSLSKVY